MLPEEMFASDEDREDFDRAERSFRHATTPMSLQVDAETGEMTSPTGYFTDDELAVMQLRYQLRRS